MRSFPVLAVLMLLGAVFVVRPASAQPADWTIMVYMDADNNLEGVGIDDFLEMSSVTSSNIGDRVNVVVQMDRAIPSNVAAGYSGAYGDWTDTRIFYIVPGLTPDPANALATLGEGNMADPAELYRFVNWTMFTYPANFYFLVLWDHGLGWQGVVLDESAPGDRLTAIELRSALSAIVAANNRRIDLMGNDACRMTLEIMYELSPFVDYFVGSEKDEPLEGWPYGTFLGALAADPSLVPSQVASTLVDKYVESYEGVSLYSVALSAVNAATLRTFVADFDAFIVEVLAHEPYFTAEVVTARDATEHYEEFGEDYDLYHFVENLLARIPSPRLARYADVLFASFDAALIHERHWDNPDAVNGVRAANAHGLSLFFPTIGGDPLYAQLAHSLDTSWDEFLLTYPLGTRPTISLTASAVSVDGDADGIRETLQVTYTPGATGVVSMDLFWQGSFLFTRDFGATGNRSYSEDLPFAFGGSFDIAVYLLVGDKIQAYRTLQGIPVEQLVVFRGEVAGPSGAPLDGAIVTLLNARTGQTLSDTVESGRYEIAAVLPTWFRIGDSLLLEVTAGDQRATVVFEAPVPVNGTVTQDLWLSTVGMGPWYLAIGALAILAAIAVGFALYFRRRRGGELT